MQDYRKLTVWAHAHALTLHVYRETERWPRRGDHGLAGQLRRAAASVPANIAEGAHRRTRTEFRRFLDIAYASAGEADYHLLLARDLGLLAEGEYGELLAKVTRVKRMLAGLTRRVHAAALSPDD
jgi:four helix bundle protein